MGQVLAEAISSKCVLQKSIFYEEQTQLNFLIYLWNREFSRKKSSKKHTERRQNSTIQMLPRAMLRNSRKSAKLLSFYQKIPPKTRRGVLALEENMMTSNLTILMRNIAGLK